MASQECECAEGGGGDDPGGDEQGEVQAAGEGGAGLGRDWVIASPDTHHQLVRQAGYTYDQLEEWVRATLSAALFTDR